MSARSSTEKSLQIIEHLAGVVEGMSLAQACSTFDLPKSVAHRMLGQLINCGYVAQGASDHRYYLSLRLPMLGFKYLAATGTPDIWQPVLDELAETSGEYVALSVAEGESLIWVANARGKRTALRYEPLHGPVIRFATTASGVIWLSSISNDEAVRLVATQRNLPQAIEGYAPNGPKSIKELLRRIEIARAKAYGISLEAGEPGIHAIAVAIKSAAKGAAAHGTISIAGPAFRLPEKKLLSFLPALKRAAAALEDLWPLRPTARINAGLLEANANQHKSRA